MRAAILYGKEDLRVEQIDDAVLGEGEVRIAIEATLTCGTDLKVYRRGYHARMIIPPAAFGHELSGTICEVGRGVTGWTLGDRVVVANSAPCGCCDFCQRGQENLCNDLLFLNGAYAERIVVPARLVAKNMLRLADQTPFVAAALVEPLACVVNGLADLKLHSGERVLTIGTGPVGLMFIALANAAGCQVTAAGRGAERLIAARRLGASIVGDVEKGEIPEEAFDVVIEAVGKPETWEEAVRKVRKGGRVNFFGGCPAGTSISFETGLIHYSNLTLLASFHHTPRTIRQALHHIESGLIQAADFVTGECPLSRLPELLQSMTAGNKAIKTRVRVDQ
ncbi:MAG: alcohol dehydrogenase catalytic domain-containing protein [Verrucomicrobia bacterium]|nr:alcohol dehydrogenase catalytic domain-containing protein [Verrucomicrobiota bacterium]MSU04678.1 alcohol dehydrogenase [Pedosphaera sp.]